jgi:hypothetical protein
MTTRPRLCGGGSPMVNEVFWAGRWQAGIMPNAEGRVPSVIEGIVDTIFRPSSPRNYDR